MTSSFLVASSVGLPEGVTIAEVFTVLIPIAIITVFLRWIPFGAGKALKGSSLLSLLAITMPIGVMTVLVVYTLHGAAANPGGWIAGGLGVLATLLLHWWRRDAAISILGGTAAYMLLVNLIF